MLCGPELLAFCCIFKDKNHDKKPGLGLEDQRRWLQRFPRITLNKHCQSAFKHMCDSGNDHQALIDCCAVDLSVFQELLQLFQLVFDAHRAD